MSDPSGESGQHKDLLLSIHEHHLTAGVVVPAGKPTCAGMAFVNSAGGVGAGAFGCTGNTPTHEPVPGSVLLSGASKLHYSGLPDASPNGGTTVTPAKEAAKASMERHASAKNWQQWSSTD